MWVLHGGRILQELCSQPGWQDAPPGLQDACPHQGHSRRPVTKDHERLVGLGCDVVQAPVTLQLQQECWVAAGLLPAAWPLMLFQPPHHLHGWKIHVMEQPAYQLLTAFPEVLESSD